MTPAGKSGSENDNSAMLAFLQDRIEGVRHRINPNAGVILAHHTKKITKKLLEEDPFQGLSGAGSLRSFYTTGIIMFRPDESRSIKQLMFELRNGEGLENKYVDKIDGRWRELELESARLVNKDYGQKLDAERRRKHDKILEIIFDDARKGELYTSSMFCQVWEHKAELGGRHSIRDRIEVLTSKGYIKFVKEGAARSRNGFPCQDISVAGKKAGITGSRSGLWKEYARLINELKPRYAIIENVANLRSSGLVTVLTDLWQIGYDAEWHCVPASALGAPHRRDRIWIIAYPNRERCNGGRNHREKRYIQGDQERFDSKIYEEWHRGQSGSGSVCEILADTVRAGLEGHGNLSGNARSRGQILQPSQVSLLRSLGGNPCWGNEPEISRLKDNGLNPDWVEWLMGFPIGWTEGGSRKERLCSLGNAVVPIIPEMIAYSINEYEKTYVHTHLSRQHDCETV